MERSKELNPKFGTYQNRMAMDFDADRKIRECLVLNIIGIFKEVNDKDTYMWLVRMIVWILGRYFCMQGGEEICKVLCSKIEFDEGTSGLDNERKYVKLIPDEKQTHLGYSHH